MVIVHTLLNSLISKLVTRDRVIKATGCSEEDFEGGVEAFISDFRREGWCKTELCDILDTLFHLDREINEYGTYWF